MKRAPKMFYIKERHNPQLGVYYIAMGQMTKTAAKEAAGGVYGTNIMRAFMDEQTYKDELAALKEKGEKVQ